MNYIKINKVLKNYRKNHPKAMKKVKRYFDKLNKDDADPYTANDRLNKAVKKAVHLNRYKDYEL